MEWSGYGVKSFCWRTTAIYESSRSRATCPSVTCRPFSPGPRQQQLQRWPFNTLRFSFFLLQFCSLQTRKKKKIPRRATHWLPSFNPTTSSSSNKFSFSFFFCYWKSVRVTCCWLIVCVREQMGWWPARSWPFHPLWCNLRRISEMWQISSKWRMKIGKEVKKTNKGPSV